MLDVNVKFEINDGYRTKNDVTKGLFGAPGSTVPALFELDRKVSSPSAPMASMADGRERRDAPIRTSH